jgi:hypothetical protein
MKEILNAMNCKRYRTIFFQLVIILTVILTFIFGKQVSYFIQQTNLTNRITNNGEFKVLDNSVKSDKNFLAFSEIYRDRDLDKGEPQ